MASLKRDVQSMVNRLVRDHGCTARLTTSGHWRITGPGRSSISMARTPSDQRALANARADVKRHLGITL